MIKIFFNLCLLLFILLSCNNYQNTDSNLVIIDSVNKQVLKNENSIDTINKQVLKDKYYIDSSIKKTIIRGNYSHLTNDTLYIADKKGVTILKYYLQCQVQNMNGIDVDINILDIEESIHDNYLYISMYAGDALPYKAILADLKQHKIIVENDRYQYYLGYSANGLYHLFEGGSSGSVGDIAVYNSNNELLKETGYYTSIANQLKWLGNEFYYYSDIDEEFSNERSVWSPITSLIKVQKFLWKENETFPLNEFTQAFME